MIIYKDIKNIDINDLKDLFLSLNWESGYYPEKLEKAIKNYDTVITAWDDFKLVGLISSIDDGIMTSYIHYLLVNPSYQGKGIGKVLVNKLKEIYKDYLNIVLISYNESIKFYESLGFITTNNSTPMSLTKLKRK